MVCDCCPQLCAVLRKNWLLKRRRWCSTLLEILLPVIIMLFMVLIRNAISREVQPSTTYTPQGWYWPSEAEGMLAFVGDESLPLEAAFKANFPTIFNQTLRFSSNDALDDYCKLKTYGAVAEYPQVWAAIVLNKGAPQWDYTIRMNSSIGDRAAIPSTALPNVDKLQKGANFETFYQYLGKGWTPLQLFVDSWIFNQANATLAPLPFANNTGNNNYFIPSDGFNYGFTSFPTVAYERDSFADVASGLLGFFIVIAFIWPFTRLVRNFVFEKEKKIKEGMKMMGLKDAVWWMSWCITYLIMFIIMCILIVLVSGSSVYKYSDKGLIFLYFFVFSLSIFAMAALFNTFFSKARSSATVGAVLFLGSYFPYFAVFQNTNYSGKTGCCILSTTCFGLGADVIAKLESSGQGANYGTWTVTVNDFDLNTCIGMMWLDTLIYLLFAWYLDKVLPSEFGSPYPPWFIFMSSFWCPKKSRLIAGEKYGGDGGLPLSTMKSEGKEYVGTVEEGEGREKKEGEDRSGYFEAVGAEVKRNGGVAIKDIQKEFNVDGQLVRAVRGINLELFEGQITALLGHNGAGKSTLISMLTGLIPPTDGDAEFYGMSLREDLQSIRTSMGVCPQHDVLFDELTVVEHLQLFGRLKGMTGDLSGPINEIIADVGLTEKKDAFSSTLSGGQKRKLSIAIALIGGSKVVFLDECTSGMDVYSRRWIWNMLLKKKEGRVIILTTHFMDEADQLGDRIAIMAKGKLQCCGSSLFLKNLYGVGYTMTISKTETAETARIQELVKSHVPTSEQLGLAGGEISFRLPFKASSSFPDMFTDFDRRIGGDSESLGIRSYGIAVTTLEEVFLRVGKEETVTVADKRAASERIRSYSDRRISISKEKKELTETLLVEKPEGEKKKDKFDELLALKCEHENVFWTHFRALFIKRMRNAYRDRKQWIMQVFVPILITFAGLAALKWAPQASDSLKVLSTSQFNTPNYIPYTQAQGLPFNTSSLFDNTLPSEGVPVLALSNTTVSDDEFNTYLLNSIPDQTQIRYLGYNINPPFNPPTTAQANLYVNTSAIHAIPIAMNLLHSNYLRELTGDPTADITVSSFPLPLTASLSSVSGLTGALIIGIGFAFIPSSWVAFAVKERETNAKHQQLISGVSIYSYWFSTMTWDCVNYTIPAILALILIAGFNIEALVGSNAGATILAIILYAPSIAAYTYLWSFAFKSHSTAQNTMVLIYILTGVLLALVSFFLSVIPSTRTANLKLKFLYRLLPNFCFGECLINLITKDILFVWGKPQTTWSMEIMGFPCLFMMWETFFYLFCVFAIEKVLSTPYLLKYFYRNPRVTDPPHEDDEDVAAEKKRMQSPSDDIVQVKGLRKEYGSLLGSVGKVAVKDLWFGIPKGECFGFLGINGAGKTTSLQMLTGAEYPTAGSAILNGFDIFTQQEELRRHLGYCPQFDALIETLTATETLTLYARIKGVPEARVAEYVDAIIEKVALREYANRPCGGYSGGNKRKLSVGVAMIGNPSIIILDEPSTGMDPAAKRFMWDLISSTSTNRSLILTTHSLEESEALCHRIGIMVSGRLRCLGSAQHLRSRFGKGYQIEFKIEDSKTSITNAQKWIEETFTNPQLVEIHGDHLKYKIARDLSLGKVFSEIERNKEKYRILEYSCSEYSLEQIFIHFAKQQEEEQATVGGVVGSGERGHETELVTFKDAKTPQSPDEEV